MKDTRPTLTLTPSDRDLISRALRHGSVHTEDFWACPACSLITRLEGTR